MVKRFAAGDAFHRTTVVYAEDYDALAARLAEIESQRVIKIAETVLPAFGHSFTAPVESWEVLLDWLRDNCVIVTRKEWDRLRATDSANEHRCKRCNDTGMLIRIGGSYGGPCPDCNTVTVPGGQT